MTVQRSQPKIDLVQDLRMDAEMLKDGHQENLTRLWHSDVVKEAALNALKAAEVIEQYRADSSHDEQMIATLKARIEELEPQLAATVEMARAAAHCIDRLDRMCRGVPVRDMDEVNEAYRSAVDLFEAVTLPERTP